MVISAVSTACGGNHVRTPLLAVREMRRDFQPPRAADAHAFDAVEQTADSERAIDPDLGDQRRAVVFEPRAADASPCDLPANRLALVAAACAGGCGSCADAARVRPAPGTSSSSVSPDRRRRRSGARAVASIAAISARPAASAISSGVSYSSMRVRSSGSAPASSSICDRAADCAPRPPCAAPCSR